MSSARVLSDYSLPHLEQRPHPSVPPTNDDIEAVIQMATSSGMSQDSRSPAPLRDTRTQLFVGNLPYRVRWQDLKDLFRRAGTVLRADVSLGPDNRSRGYGNVVLATAEDAGRAIDMLNGYCWQTRILEVRPDRFGASVDEPSLAIGNTNGNPSGFPHAASNTYDETFGHDPVGSGTGTKTLFVGNLPFHIQWQDLKDLFRAAGAVARADVALGPDGRSRGFGTVSFVTEDSAERARRMFDGYEFNGRQLKVHYDKFSPSAAPVPLVGVPPLPSTLSQYDALASHLRSLQLESQQPERRQFEHLSQPELDGLSHPQLDALRRSDLDSLTPSQLEALLIRTNMLSSSRSSNLGSSPPTSASLTTSSPLHTQSLAPTAVHSLAPTPTHPHSLTSSPHLGFANTSSTSFASLSLPLPLGTEALTTKLPSLSGVAKNADSLSLKLKTDAKLGSDLHLLSSKNTSRTSSFNSSRPSISVGSPQAQSYTITSSGSSRPSFVTSSSLADGVSFSQRSSFGVSQSQRPSFSSSTSQRPSFGSTSQRPSFGGGSAQRPTFSASSLLQGPFFDDERDVQGSISQPVSLGTSRENSSSSIGASSLPPVLSRPASGVDHDTVLTHPPANGGWPSMSSPRPTSPRSAILARPILSSDSSNKSQSVWGASSKVQSSQGSPPVNAEGLGNTDAVATVLGSLGMRRSKAQAHKAAEKERVPSLDPKVTSPSPQKPTSPQKSSQSSSRRQPGPISLPPPSTFTLPMLSPHHPQSPMYHVGYAPSHPGSPLYHPAMNSPVHHPAMSPLHHPSVHPYHHHMHYGVMTPHGLPPITPSMPPFSFQPQQKANGRTILTERPGSNEGSRHSQATEGRSEAQPLSSPYHHPAHSQVPYLPPHMFSPGIPLSPGIMIPVSPGYPPSVTMVPLTPGGVPLPMTPGVTMTPGAFWPQAPWINPAPGAPVHADDHRHNQGYPQNSGGDYFPPQSELDDNTGYFPPVSSLANEIFKEGSEFHSGAKGEEGHSRSSSACAGMVSPTLESAQEEKQIKNDRAHGITRTTSVHNNGKGSGTPKRASLTHRPDSDPIVPSLCSNGERQS